MEQSADKSNTISNPNENAVKADLNKDKAPHATILSHEKLKHSGKDDNQLQPGIKSVAPSTGKTASWAGDENKEYKMLDDVSALIGDDGDSEYPYEKLKEGQAFFVPTKPNDTTDALLAKILKSIDLAKKRYGEIEVNEDGDKIMEVLTIEIRKRNEDGTVRMNGDKPIVGADFHHRYKYNYTRNFIAKPVYADQELAEGVKAEGDGVVVIRVA